MSESEGISKVARGSRRSKSLRNALILLTVFVFPVLFLFALYLFQGSGLRRAIAGPAIFAAQSSPEVAAQIGLPIEPGWPIRGTVTQKGPDGNADLSIPLKGSHGRGVLVEWAQKSNGKWHACTVEFRSADGKSVGLAVSSHTACEPE